MKQINSYALSKGYQVGAGIQASILPVEFQYSGTVEQFLNINKEYEWSPGYGYDLYCQEEKITSLSIDMKAVPNYAFYNCKSIKELTLLNTVCIEQYAFTYCELKKVNLPKTLKEIQYYAFFVDKSLTNSRTSAFKENNENIYLRANDYDYYVLIIGANEFTNDYIIKQNDSIKIENE